MEDLKQFYKYVIPSVCAMLISGLYFIVDGIFVARGIGESGLTAVNLAWPFISIMIGVAAMVMMGGATMCAIAFGENDTQKANSVFIHSMLTIITFSLIIAVVAWFFAAELAILLGASETVLRQTADYIRYYNLFCVFFTSSMVLSAFIRNDGNPTLAFWGMTIGALTNIFLDWLFVFPLQMGITGAALASGLGQIVSCVILSFHFLRKKGNLRLCHPTFEKNILKEILRLGIPELITQMSMPVTMLWYNLIIMKIIGEVGVAAYAVMGYVFMIAISVSTGVAQGAQPLIGKSFGEKRWDKEHYFVKLALRCNVILALLIYIGTLKLAHPIISIFSSDPIVFEIASNGFLIYGLSFVFVAINAVYTMYFYSTKRIQNAIILSSLRSFILNTLCILVIPFILGPKALWAGIVACEVLTVVVAYRLYKKSSKDKSGIRNTKPLCYNPH